MLMRLDTTAYDNINESSIIIDQRRMTKHRLDKVKRGDHNNSGEDFKIVLVGDIGSSKG